MQDSAYLEALRTYWKCHQAFPSMSKLCSVVGLSSTSSVFALVGRLVEGGYLERTERRIAPTKKFFSRPLVPNVRAEAPEPDGQGEVALRSIDDYLIDNPNRTVLRLVYDDSMQDAGLLNGDLVTVERNSPTKPGDIVVAIVNDVYAIRILRFDRSDQYYLEPANTAFENLHPEGSLDIFGVVTGLVRRLRR